MLQIVQRTSDFYHTCKSSRTVTMTPKAVRWIGWKSPEEGWVKVNTDGTSKAEGIAGCGGLIRDHRGHWLGGFAKFVGVSSAFVAVAELWGVFVGIEVC